MYNEFMNIKSFEKRVKTEAAAKKFVSKYLRKNRHAFCPYCGSRRFWYLHDNRRRCKRCKKAFHDLTRLCWNEVHLPMDDWLRIVKNVQAETLLGITVKKVRRGSVVYTDKYRAYDFLIPMQYEKPIPRRFRVGKRLPSSAHHVKLRFKTV